MARRGWNYRMSAGTKIGMAWIEAHFCPGPVAAALAALALGACVYTDAAMPAANDLPSLARQQDDPQLALMDHVLGAYFASDIASRPTVCASISDGGDPVALPPEDERALIERYPLLAPFARCAWSAEGWQDKQTGQPALVFQLHGFSCASQARCTGFAAYTSGNTASMTHRYTMDWRRDAWAFASDPRIIMER